jgi:hypothetical protein
LGRAAEMRLTPESSTPADVGRRGTATPGCSRRASHLGRMEISGRGPAHIQDDADAHRSRSLRGVTATDSAGGDVHLSPLQGRGGHGTTHTGALPGVGRSATRPAAQHRREFSPRRGHRSYAQGAVGVQRRPFLLRGRDAREGASGKRP